MKRFYIIGSEKVNSEERTLSHALDQLDCGLSENENGWIKCFQFIDDDELEYELVWHRDYIKHNNKLVVTASW